MPIYEYAPKSQKKKEKLTALMLVCMAVVLLVISALPNMILPALWQLGAVLALTFSIWFFVRFLIRSYVYAVCEGRQEGECDLVISERVGKRVGTVLRISCADVKEAVLVTKQNRSACKGMQRSVPCWQYYAEWNCENLYQLTVCSGETLYYVLLQADQKLLSFLNFH